MTKTILGLPFYSANAGFNEALQKLLPQPKPATPVPEAVPQAVPQQDSWQRQSWCMLVRAIQYLFIIIMCMLMCMLMVRSILYAHDHTVRQIEQTSRIRAQLDLWQFCERAHAEVANAKRDYAFRSSEEYENFVEIMEQMVRDSCNVYHYVVCEELGNKKLNRCLPPYKAWGWQQQ